MFPILQSIASFKRAKLIGILFLSLVWAIVIIIIASGVITFVSAHLIHVKIGWLDKLLNFIIGILAGVGGWFMLPAIVPFIAGTFQEKVIAKIELIYYPNSIRKTEPKFWPDFKHDVAFTIWALFLNILVLPLYFFGIGFVVSIILNTYLLGREFFENAAGYHLGKPSAKDLLNKNKTSVYIGGLVLTILSIVPIVNLFVPIFAIVWMVHLYHNIIVSINNK